MAGELHVRVLRDGTTVQVRPPTDGDVDRVRSLWERLSPGTVHRSFGGMARLGEAVTRLLLGLDEPDQQLTRVATLGRGDAEVLVGVAQVMIDPDDPTTAEFTEFVEDAHQGRGVGTALLQELAEVGRDRGIRRLTGEVMADNVRMLRVLRDLGLEVHQRLEGATVRTDFTLQPTDRYLEALAANERTAAREAVARFLRPERIAVVGASRNRQSIGGLVFVNLLQGGFTGPVYPVNPKAHAVAGVAAYPSLAACPEAPDLVVVCVPALPALDVVEEAGRLGVRAVCVISAGFAECGPEGQALQNELLARAHAHGLRLVGPNCMGISNGAEDVRMNGTFSPEFPRPGRLSFLSQSGALGLSVLQRFAQRDLGLASFVSVGNTADLGPSDVLSYWEDDPQTDVVLLYLESVPGPRRFARVARRLTRRKPIVAVKAGRTTVGQRAATSHTAALAAGDIAVEALFHQAGVIRAGTLDELFGISGVLASQPVPAGRRVAILTNGGGPGILGADAAVASGLELPELSDDLQRRLGQILPPAAATSNPVDLIASCTAEQYRQAITLVRDSGEVDALIVIFIPPFLTRAEDVAEALADTVADEGHLPLIAVFMGSPEVPTALTQAGIPNFELPEEAATTLGRIAAYGEWLARPQGTIVRPGQIDTETVQTLVSRTLDGSPEGVWLTADESAILLRAYGIPLATARVVADAAGAATAQREIGRPVAVKLAAAVHKRDVGGVVLGVATPEDAAAAVATIEGEVRDHGRSDLAGPYLVQEMIDDGVEVLVGVTHDPSFGPLVMVGLGGTMVELLRDVAVRITPLTDVDVDEMLTSLKTAPLLTGYRGSAPVDVPALRDLLFRISALVEDVPEIRELDLNPVFVRTQGLVAVDARIRVAAG